MDRINEILNKIKIFDKAYIYLIESLYTDEEILINFSEKNLKYDIILDIVEKLESSKKKYDNIKKKIFNDTINFCINRGIEDINSNYRQNLLERGISPILAYIYSLFKKKDIDFYYNIYIEEIKNINLISNEDLNVNIRMYKSVYETYIRLIEENKKLKEQIEEITKLIKFDDIEDEIIILESKEEKVEIEYKEYKGAILIGFNKNLAKKYEGIEFINTNDVVRYKDKIRNANLIIFDTSKNSHKAYYFSKSINKNIKLI